MGWIETSVSSWKEFVEKVDELQFNAPSSTFLFRGQTNAKWQLAPSLLRNFLNTGKKASYEEACEVEHVSVYRFRQEAHHYLKPTVLPLDLEYLTDANIYLKWLTLMQHHGVPTRLLDWSQSSYVSLYFAVENLGTDDAAVWYFDAKMLSEYYGLDNIDFTTMKVDVLRSAEDKRVLYTGVAKLQTSREIAQQGGFTFSNNFFLAHDELISSAFSTKGNDSSAYGKIIIPAAFKPEFLWRLEKANITAKTLFPGVDGIGRSLRDFIALQII